MVFNNCCVSDMEVLSEQFDEFGIIERPCNAHLGDLEVSDHVQRIGRTTEAWQEEKCARIDADGKTPPSRK